MKKPLKKIGVKAYHPGNLLPHTLELLKADKRPLIQIASDSHIPYHWLSKLADGKIKDPSVNRVEWLYAFLSGKPLAV